MKYIRYIIYTLSIAFLTWSCKPEIEVPAPQAGTADFTNFIAVGNSLTAGYSDGGLYQESQEVSLAAILAQQMNEVMAVPFKQPDIPGNGSGYFYLKKLSLVTNPPIVEIGNREPDPNWLDKVSGPFNNLGVPGIRVKDIEVVGYGIDPVQANPYFYRMVPDENPWMTYLDMVKEANPTFFTLWLGNNDVLGYAASGGKLGQDGAPGLGLGGLTDPGTFQALYSKLINVLTQNGAKGVLGTVPDVTLIPFFTFMGQSLTAIPDLPLEKTDEEFDFMNFVYWMAGYNVSPTDTIPIFQHGSNWPAFVVGPEGSTTVRTLDVENGDLVTLLFGDKIPEMQNEGLGFINPTETEAIGVLYNSAIKISTSKAKAAGAAQAGAQAQAFYAAADSAENVGDDQAADSLQTLGDQKALEAQQLASEAQDYFNQFLATLPAAKEAAPKVANPIPTEFVLDQTEVKLARQFTSNYNDIIKSFANNNPDITYFDSGKILEKVKDGVFVDGVEVNGDFLTGGAFSLDGVHLTPRGYALLANQIIGIINENFNSTVPPVNINDYHAVILP